MELIKVSPFAKDLIALSFLKGLGKSTILKILKKSPPLDDLFSYVLKNQTKKNYSIDEINVAYEKARYQIDLAKKYGHSIISYLDDVYPESLRTTFDAPVFLFCNGDLDLLSRPSVTIIGTRSPTPHGEIITKRITDWAVMSDWTITSGLAKGIDTIAHKQCLSSKGQTISVMAQGLNKVYPAENKTLAGEIVAKGGLLISEYTYDSFVGKSNFVERDRIQAGLSKAVFLIQSGLKGGSLHASKAILKYERYLFVVGQSKSDILENTENIQANLLLLGNNDFDKANLLNTTLEQNKNIIKFNNKKLYPKAINLINSFSFNKQRKNSSYEMF